MDILILGNISSGKSLMLRRLKELFECSVSFSNEPTIPTVGMDVQTVEYIYTFPTKRTLQLNLREVSSAMSSRWKSYIPYANVIIVSRSIHYRVFTLLVYFIVVYY